MKTNILKTGRFIRVDKAENSHIKNELISKKVNTLKITFLYIASILSISFWLLSIKLLPFGDILQFLLGAVVLTVNLFVFKFSKI